MSQEKNQDWLYRLMQDQQRSSEISSRGGMPDVPRHNEHLSPRANVGGDVGSGTGLDAVSAFAGEVAQAIGVMTVGASRPVSEQPDVAGASFQVPVNRDSSTQEIQTLFPSQPTQQREMFTPMVEYRETAKARHEETQAVFEARPVSDSARPEAEEQQRVQVDVNQTEVPLPLPPTPAAMVPAEVTRPVATEPPSAGVMQSQQSIQREQAVVDVREQGRPQQSHEQVGHVSKDQHAPPATALSPGPIRPAFLGESDLPPSTPVRTKRPGVAQPEVPLVNPHRRDEPMAAKAPVSSPMVAEIPFQSNDARAESGWHQTTEHTSESTLSAESHDSMRDYYEQQYQFMQEMTLLASFQAIKIRELSDRVAQMIPMDANPHEYL